MFDFVHSDPRRTWIGTLFEVCMIVLWSFCITREVYCSGPWLQTKQKCTTGQPSANASQYQNVRIWGSPLAHLRHCLRPRPLCNIFRTTPLALNGISMAGLHSPPPPSASNQRCVRSPSQYFRDSFPGKHALVGRKPAANRGCHSCAR